MEQTKQCMGCMEYYDASSDTCPHCGYSELNETPFVLHMAPNTELNRRYTVGKALGYGSFGVTYIGWDKLMKRKVAIKEYLPSEFATRMTHTTTVIVPEQDKEKERYERGMLRFHKEAEKLAQLGKVDGTVYIYDTFEDNNTAYIVMEYLEGETLESLMKRKGVIAEKEFDENGKPTKTTCMSESEVLDIMLPVLTALEQVHEHDILHRDISPANIFISYDEDGNKSVKLIDFGSSRFTSGSHSKSLTVLLNPGYSPEEQYRSSGEQDTYTDIYAAAAVMYHMVTGHKPEDALERRTSIENKKKDLLKDPSRFNKEISDNFETAIMNALNVKIEDRTATAADFVGELISFEKVERKGQNIKKIDFMKWPLWAKITIPAAGLAALALLIFFLVRVLNPDSMTDMAGKVRISDYYGIPVADAIASATASKIQAEEAYEMYIPNMEPGLVCGQSIDPGYIVYENALLSFYVSSEKETYAMPDVTGMTRSQAEKWLNCMDVVIQYQDGSADGIAPGCVISQDRDAYEDNTIDSGDTVVLTLAGGVTEASDKLNKCKNSGNYVGLSYEEALKEASSKGESLVVVDREFTKNCTTGEILAQSAKDSDCVGVVVGVKWQSFDMVSLNGKAAERAEQLLHNIGISPDVIEEVNESRAPGVVFEQSVAKKASVEPKCDVELKVSKAASFEMPDVTGMSENEAISTLQALGLQVTESDIEYDENVPVGNVISQSVAAGTEVTRGSEITLTVCSEQEAVEVPDVTGMNFSEAKSTLQSAGFTVSKNEVDSYEADKNIVLMQLPSGGQKKAAKSVITLTVGNGKKVDETALAEELENEKEKKKDKKSTQFTWSEWGDTLPANASADDYETKTQYKAMETTTSSSESLSGWGSYVEKNQCGYSDWSDYTPSALSSSGNVEVESKTQYRYRTRTKSKETIQQVESNMPGYTLEDYFIDWDSNVSWFDSEQTTSETFRYYGSEQRQEGSHQEITGYVTEYYYCRFYKEGKGFYSLDQSRPSGCEEQGYWVTEDKVYWAGGPPKWSNDAYFITGAPDGYPYKTNGATRQTPVYSDVSDYKTYYGYQYGTKICTYSRDVYSDWSEWGSWSDSSSTGYDSDLTEEETQTVYRSREAQYEYKYEREGEWQDSEPANYSESRTVYRYKMYEDDEE